MSALGRLVVSLAANTVEFASDMGRAAHISEQAGRRINAAMDGVRGAIVGMVAGAASALSVNMFIGMTKSAIDAADNLNDLSKKTGLTVEAIGGLGFAAGQAGGDLESIAAAAGKLNKSLAEAAAGNKEFTTTFATLGIQISDANGQLKKADDVMVELAEKFSGWEDGPEKAALALKVFGKSGADIIPLLDDGGEALKENIDYYKKYSGVTQDVADKADAFNDTIGKLHLQHSAFSQTLAAELLPSLQGVADLILESKENGDAFNQVAREMGEVIREIAGFAVKAAFEIKDFTNAIAGMAAMATSVSQGNFKGAGVIFEDWWNDQDGMDISKSLRKKRDDLVDALSVKPGSISQDFGIINQDWEDKPKKNKVRAPIIPDAARADAKAKEEEARAKKVMEGQLKSIESNLEKEKNAIEFRNKLAAELRSQDLISIQNYEAVKSKSLEETLSKEQAAYDQQIAILEQHQKSVKKSADAEADKNKISELLIKKEKSLQEAEQNRQLLTLERTRAQSDLNKEMKDWLRLQENSISQIKFEGETFGKSALEIAKMTAARRIDLEVQEKIRAAKEKGSISPEVISSINSDAEKTKGMTNSALTQNSALEIGKSLQKPWESENEQYENRLKDLQSFREAQLENETQANTLIEAETDRHNKAIEEMRLSSGQTVLSIAQDSASQLYSALEQAGLEQTALGKAVFAAQKAIQIASIIVNTEVAAAAAQAGMIAAAGATAAVSGPAGPAIIAAGIAAGAAYASVTRALGYATAGIVAGTAIAGAFADGGDPPVGKISLVGERGPELFVPKTAGTIIPNELLGGGSKALSVTIVNQTSAPIGNVVEQRISDNERVLIIQEAVNATAAQFDNPNSRMSKSASRNYNLQRNRS
ncbi:MAG: hypothetical protein V4501_08125 [Pseudomonadota bacterium]